MTGIFISYSHDDSSTAKQLAALLRKSFDEVWYDENLHGGADWWREITQRVVECDYFIFLISNESLDSRYCLDELELARFKDKFIIPIKVRRTVVIPPHLNYLNGLQLIEMLAEPTIAGLNEIYAAILHNQSSNSTKNTKLIDHYLLFWWRGRNDWGRDDWLSAVDWVAAYRLTCGFDEAEAMRAKRVTIVGADSGVSETVEQRLKDAGCLVERLDGKHYEDTAGILLERAEKNVKFQGGTIRRGYED